MAGRWRGSLRKNQVQALSQRRLTRPTITNEPRQDVHTSSPAIIGGVKAFPSRAKECVIPCAEPQRASGSQLVIARVAVGKAAPSPNPSARRNAKREAKPLARLVSTVAAATIAQQAANVNLAPQRSPIHPPMS